MPCATHSDYPCFNPLTFTVNSLVSVTGTASADWVIRPDAHWLTIMLTFLKLNAWALAALLLAGITGLLRKT